MCSLTRGYDLELGEGEGRLRVCFSEHLRGKENIQLRGSLPEKGPRSPQAALMHECHTSS